VAVPVAPAPTVAPFVREARQLYFATGSTAKLHQYVYLFGLYGFAVHAVRHLASVPEPQVDGFGDVSEAELVADPLKRLSRFAARTRRYPLLVEDTMLFIDHFNDDVAALPGPDTKRWWLALGNKGLLRLMEGSRRRAATYVCQLGVTTGPGTYDTFRAELRGRIALGERVSEHAIAGFPRTNAAYFHPVFVPDGAGLSLAEMGPDEFARYDYRHAVVQRAAPSLEQLASGAVQGRLF